MNNKPVIAIADTSPIISLALINKLELLDLLFSVVYIPKAVWKELITKSTEFDESIRSFFEKRTKTILSKPYQHEGVDYGEAEAITLYKELNADYLIIDDRKAVNVAANENIKCIGTLAILIKAKEKKYISSLRDLFLIFLENKRFFSKKLLNAILEKYNETHI